MEVSPVYQSSFFISPLLFPYHFVPENHVHWTQTPQSHIYSADLPGVKKEEIRVEVEDSRYMIIRTEGVHELEDPAKSFMRKFRLPNRVNLENISASYEDGVLTVTVPRTFVRGRGFFIQPDDRAQLVQVSARAA
ncbi:chaperone [Lithospermum erythrorhizon]|uniref:Chaperone n=1 Tax=Lithospermum erythrorhizon TaxID=34254 RepID=A0AAV3S2M5_LITER